MFFKQKALFLTTVFSALALTNHAQATDNVIKITKDNFTEEVLHSSQPVVVDFFAEWCPPCQRMKPIVKQAAQELTNIKFATVNVDEEKGLAGKFNIQTIPTIIIFNNGKIIARLSSSKSYEDFKQAIEAVLV